MARCDCCGCVLEDDYGTSTVSGDGTADDPFVVTRVDPAFVRPAVKLSRGTLASVPNNTPTVIPWATEVFDTDNMWVIGSPNRITFRTRGIFQFGAQWQWPNNVTQLRGAEWYHTPIATGVAVRLINELTDPPANVFQRQLNYQWYFEVGDYIELYLMQSSGGALNLDSANAWAVYMGRFV